MKPQHEFPSFDILLPDLDQFILALVKEYKAGRIKSWSDLEEKVNTFFTAEKMDQIDSIVPHWRKMASYADGLTLTHVMCVFMGMYITPEFLNMPRRRQQLMKWIILFHDIEKEVRDGKRDHAHAFRSAVGAARTLPSLGFPVMPEYEKHLDEWDEYTRSAITKSENSSDTIQDNSKLPKIIEGIECMFGHNRPTGLIIRTILFHLSVDVKDWPPPSPLTNEEIKMYFDEELIPLLLVMHLADSSGWNTFKPELWERVRINVIEVFKKLERGISQEI